MRMYLNEGRCGRSVTYPRLGSGGFMARSSSLSVSSFRWAFAHRWAVASCRGQAVRGLSVQIGRYMCPLTMTLGDHVAGAWIQP